MDMLEIARYFAALLLVLALIGGAGLVARKWGVPGVTKAVSDKRLSVVETLMIGPRQKLLIVRRDQTEHVIFTGPEGVCLVENISTPSGSRATGSVTA
jgi:flagellar protein FliO/FliZ